MRLERSFGALKVYDYENTINNSNTTTVASTAPTVTTEVKADEMRHEESLMHSAFIEN